MQHLTGVADKHAFASSLHVKVIEARSDGKANDITKAFDQTAGPVLFDDDVGMIGSKVDMMYRERGGGVWWLKTFWTANEVQRATALFGKDTKKFLDPSMTAAGHAKLRKSGGQAHYCPYLKGIFHAASQLSHADQALSVNSRHAFHLNFSEMTNTPELYTASLQELKLSGIENESVLRGPRTSHLSPLALHPHEIAENMPTANMFTLLHARVRDQAVRSLSIDTHFDQIKTSESLHAVAKIHAGGSTLVRLRKKAIEDGLMDFGKLRTLLAVQDTSHHHDSLMVGAISGGQVAIVSHGSVTLNTTVRQPEKVPEAWMNAKQVVQDQMHITLQACPSSESCAQVAAATLRVPIQVPHVLRPLDVIKMIRTSWVSQYLLAALSHDKFVVEMVYKRSPGGMRFPPTVEQTMSTYLRNSQSSGGKGLIDKLNAEHALSADDAAAAVSAYNKQHMHEPPPVVLRVACLPASAGLVVTINTWRPRDAQCALIVLCHAVAKLDMPRDTLGPGDVQQQPREPPAEGEMETSVHDIIEEAGKEDAQATPGASARPAVTMRNALDSLMSVDPELFSFRPDSKHKTYARQCGKAALRQPIAVTGSELKDMGEDAPESVSAGPARASYICPEVWCEASRTAMTRKQAEKVGWKCPDGSRAEDLMKDKYWDGSSSRYIGFLQKTKHPQGYCMPCCFRTMGKRHDECMADSTTQCASDADAPAASASSGQRYIMSTSTVPLPEGRMGNVDLGEGNRIPGVVRVGVNQESQTFLSCIAVIEKSSVPELIERIKRRLTPALVASIASGVVYEFLTAQSPLYAQSVEAKREFVAYAHSEVGAEHLAKRGLLNKCTAVDKIDPNDPNIAREMVVANAFTTMLSFLESGSNKGARAIQLLSMAALGKRYPMVSKGVGSAKLSCLRWDREFVTAPVKGLIYKDGKVLEPLKNVPDTLLRNINSHIAASCGSVAKLGNTAVLRALEFLNYPLQVQVADEGHVIVGFLIEGNLFVPCPQPHVIDPSLPMRYMTELPEADVAWTPESVRELFAFVGLHAGLSMYNNATFSPHCVFVGGHVVPLAGGAACLRASLTASRILNMTRSRHIVTKHMQIRGAHENVVASLLNKLFHKDDHAYVAIVDPLSPLAPWQKQALFEEVLVNDLPSSEVQFLDAVADEAREVARPGEVVITDDDFASGAAELIIDRAAIGLEAGFKDAITSVSLQHLYAPAPLDVEVVVPKGLAHMGFKGKASSAGTVASISSVTSDLGVPFTRAHHGRTAARRMLTAWRLDMDEQDDVPPELAGLLQEADVEEEDGQVGKGDAWEQLCRVAEGLEPEDSDVTTAFSSAPACLYLYDSAGTRVCQIENALAPWDVHAWRRAGSHGKSQSTIAFGTRGGSALIPRVVKK